jgi:hypothetical protein
MHEHGFLRRQRWQLNNTQTLHNYSDGGSSSSSSQHVGFVTELLAGYSSLTS